MEIGDEILTNDGWHGKIIGISDVLLKITDNKYVWYIYKNPKYKLYKILYRHKNLKFLLNDK